MASYLIRTMRITDSAKFSICASSKAKFQKSFKTSMGASGPLIDGPDYTFLDGRPTPLRAGQRRRAEEQFQVSSKVIQLMKETKFAIESHQTRLDKEKQKRQDILDAKLKPKTFKKLE